MRPTSRIYSQSGFSLLDLMITTSIISVLATIGATNFRGFVAKARQSEAKTNLATLYAGEKAYFGEWNSYTGDLRDIGVVYTGHPLKYDIGFTGPGVSPPNYTPIGTGLCGPLTAYNTEVSACAIDFGSVQAAAPFQAAPASGVCGAGMNPTTNQFRASAVGYTSGTILDIWSIDETNMLCNNMPGT